MTEMNCLEMEARLKEEEELIFVLEVGDRKPNEFS
jgi:hypothetical protein